MSIPFDPYYKWLGISPAEQPPNHYRLLGINLFEADRDVIETAADGRMALLRSFHTGPNADASQQLLNEVAAAKLCLLKPDRRANYDEILRRRLGPEARDKGPEARQTEAKGRKTEGGKDGEEPKTEGAGISSALTPQPSVVLISPRKAAWDLAVAEACAASITLPRRRRRWQINPYFVQLVFGAGVVAGIAYGGLYGFTKWQDVEFKSSSRAPRLSPTGGLLAGASADAAPISNPSPSAGSSTSPPSRPAAPEANFGDATSTPSKFDSAQAGPASLPISATPSPVIGPTPAGPAERHRPIALPIVHSPVPSAEAQQKAAQILKEVLKDDYEHASSIDGQLALAHRLAELANDTSDDPTARYVLANQALDLAVKYCDVRFASDLVGGFHTYYEVDFWDLRAKTLVRLARSARDPEARAVIADAAFELVEKALADNRGDAAFELATLTMNLANSAKDIPLREQARKLTERAQTLQKSAKAIEASNDALRAHPDDPEANLVIGKYKCFAQQNWSAGLPYLAKGSDAPLRALAEWELKLPSQPAEQLKLADAWWDLAQQHADPKADLEAGAMRAHATYWYRLAMPSLSGISLAKAKQRSEAP